MERNILDEDIVNHPLKKSYTFHLYPVVLWGVIYLVGELFKLMHWPNASVMLVSAYAGLLAYLLNIYMTLKGINKTNQVLFILIIVKMISVLILNKNLSLYGIVVFLVVSLAFFIISFIIKNIRLKKIAEYNATLM